MWGECGIRSACTDSCYRLVKASLQDTVGHRILIRTGKRTLKYDEYAWTELAVNVQRGQLKSSEECLWTLPSNGSEIEMRDI